MSRDPNKSDTSFLDASHRLIRKANPIRVYRDVDLGEGLNNQAHVHPAKNLRNLRYYVPSQASEPVTTTPKAWRNVINAV